MMNTFDNYHYVYRNAQGTYRLDSTQEFIAMHKDSHAVEKAKVEDIKKYIENLNSNNQKS